MTTNDAIKIVRSVKGPYTVFPKPFLSEATAIKKAKLFGSTTVIHQPETRFVEECWYVVTTKG